MNVVAIKKPEIEDDENIARLADAIADRLSRRPPLERTLWSSDDCADYMRVSARHFMDRVACQHTFPDPIRVPTAEGKRGHPRWYAGEVMKWVEKHR